MTKLTLLAEVFQQKIQLPLTADDHAPFEPENIVFRQEIGIDARYGDKHAGIALAVAAVHRYPAAAVLQQVILHTEFRNGLCGKEIQYRLNAMVNTHSP